MIGLKLSGSDTWLWVKTDIKMCDVQVKLIKQLNVVSELVGTNITSTYQNNVFIDVGLQNQITLLKEESTE